MFNFFKKKKTLGALLSPFDPRNIPVSAISKAPVSLPAIYFTDINFIPVLNQGQLGNCTGQAHSVIIKYFEKQEGFNTQISPRAIYSLAKKYDNYIGEGSFPNVIANNSMKLGNGTENTAPNNVNLSHADYINVPYVEYDYLPQRTKGYAWVNPTEQELKEALVNFKLVEITLPVGDWSKSPVMPGNAGYHRVVIFGYSDSYFYCRNSWGNEWGINGNFYFNFKDYKDKIFDAIVYTDIPNEIKEEFKAKWIYKYFKPNEVIGLKDELISLLDKARDLAGIPFKITSGLRTDDKNEQVGGVADSSHKLGMAVDILTDTSAKRFKILKALLDVGFTRIGIYKTHIHCDIDKTKPQGVIWYI